MYIIFLLILIQLCNCEEFICFNKTVLTYQNSDNLLNLPTIYITTPGYSSQNAIHFLSYLFLKDIIGINVDFYPYSVDDSPFFIDYWNIKDERLCTQREIECREEEEESDCTEEELIIGSDCSGYPEYYFEFLINDFTDLHMELWQLQEIAADGESYYATNLIDKTTNGLLGAVGLFIPKYVVEKYPRVVLPYYLLNDLEIREYFYNGSVGLYNTTNLIEFYSNPELFDENYPYFMANYTYGDDLYPLNVWGSHVTYIMSNWTYHIGQKYNLTFTAIGNEAKITALIKELYNAKAPFIANIYIPDENFAITDEDGNLFEFEKVAFPFNGAQSVYTECFINFECDYPLETLYKTGNRNVKNKITEITNFYNKFLLNAEQLAILQSYYLKLDDNNDLTDSEKWLNASCQWLQNFEDVWIDWKFDIERWECLNGCGILVDNLNTYIGGNCDEFNGICNCNYDELFGESCSNSCPGLSTYYNGTDYEIKFCSGHGTCNIENFRCDCDIGYGGDDCNKNYKKFKLSITTFYIILGINIIILGLNLSLYILNNYQYKFIHLSILLFSIYLILSLFESTNSLCMIRVWFFNYGRGFLGLPILKESYRLIMNKNIINNYNFEILISETVISLIFILLFLFNGSISKIYDDDNYLIFYECNSKSNLYFLLNTFYTIIMLGFLMYSSNKLRKTLPSSNIFLFKKITCNYISSIISFFIILLTFIIILSSKNLLINVILEYFAILIILVIILLLYLKILYKTNEIDLYNNFQDDDLI